MEVKHLKNFLNNPRTYLNSVFQLTNFNKQFVFIMLSSFYFDQILCFICNSLILSVKYFMKYWTHKVKGELLDSINRRHLFTSTHA